MLSLISKILKKKKNNLFPEEHYEKILKPSEKVNSFDWTKGSPPEYLLNSLWFFGEAKDFSNSIVWRKEGNKYIYRKMFREESPSWKFVKKKLMSAGKKARRTSWDDNSFIVYNSSTNWIEFHNDDVCENYWPYEFNKNDWEII